jgi:hypothetical protein
MLPRLSTTAAASPSPTIQVTDETMRTVTVQVETTAQHISRAA